MGEVVNFSESFLTRMNFLLMGVVVHFHCYCCSISIILSVLLIFYAAGDGKAIIKRSLAGLQVFCQRTGKNIYRNVYYAQFSF
jgi:hypothetical protein